MCASETFQALKAFILQQQRVEIPMAKTVDLSNFSRDELTDLIDEATNLRTTKFEGVERELEVQMEEEELRQKVEQDRAGISSTITRL